MIISRKNKFIFIRTQKTASTSIELALRKFCGSDDILTAIANDEVAKKYNFDISERNNKRYNYSIHEPAILMRKKLFSGTWKEYYTFCFERNSYKKAISAYKYWINVLAPTFSYYKDNIPNPTTLDEHEYFFKKMLNSKRFKWNDWIRYTENDEIIVDDVHQFDGDLSKVFDILSSKLNLPRNEFIEYREKTNITKSGDYDYLTSSKVILSMIEDYWCKEIEYFNYKPY